MEELLKSPLANFIELAANDCSYSGSTKELICNWVHPLFLKAKLESSQADNPNWWQAMNGPFANEYWKAAVTEIETLEGMDVSKSMFLRCFLSRSFENGGSITKLLNQFDD